MSSLYKIYLNSNKITCLDMAAFENVSFGFSIDLEDNLIEKLENSSKKQIRLWGINLKNKREVTAELAATWIDFKICDKDTGSIPGATNFPPRECKSCMG